jgi:hypothetical protein
MSRYKKPDAPKFEPVFIAGRRRASYSLATPEAEAGKMRHEDTQRIILQKLSTSMQRLEALQDYLGIPGKLGDPGHLLALLLKVADKYVPDFEVQVGAATKPGTKKVGDRFKTVTDVETMKFNRRLTSIADAIAAVANERRPRMQATELTTKYYASLREIEANEQAKELLGFWRNQCSMLHDPFLESLFWECERDQMGATVPHNVTKLPLQK